MKKDPKQNETIVEYKKSMQRRKDETNEKKRISIEWLINMKYDGIKIIYNKYIYWRDAESTAEK